MKTGVKVIVIAALIAAAFYGLYSRLQSDETRIRAVIEKTAARTRKKDAFLFMRHFDKDFYDDSGLGFDEIRYAGIRVFQTYPEVSVSYNIRGMRIDAESGQAVVSLDLSVSVVDEGDTVDLIRGARGTNSFIVVMKKRNKEWVFSESRRP